MWQHEFVSIQATMDPTQDKLYTEMHMPPTMEVMIDTVGRKKRSMFVGNYKQGCVYKKDKELSKIRCKFCTLSVCS